MIAEGNSTQARSGALAQTRRRTCRRAEMPVAGRDASFPGLSHADQWSRIPTVRHREAAVCSPSSPHRPWGRAARSRRMAWHEAHLRGPLRDGAGPDSRGCDRLDPMWRPASSIGASIAQRRTIGGAAGRALFIANSSRPWWLSFKACARTRSPDGRDATSGAVAISPAFRRMARMIYGCRSAPSRHGPRRATTKARPDHSACGPPALTQQGWPLITAGYRHKFPFRRTGSCFSLPPTPICDISDARQ